MRYLDEGGFSVPMSGNKQFRDNWDTIDWGGDVAKKKEQDGCFFVLDGSVSLVERKNGKEVSREEIDGEIVLKLLIMCVSNELDRLDGGLVSVPHPGKGWVCTPGAPGAPVVKRSKRVKK